MSTAVTALLNEIEEHGEEGLDMPQEEAEFYPDDSLHGQLINPTLLSVPLIVKQKHGVIERIQCLDYFQFFLYFVLFLGDEESVGGADSDNPLMMLFNEVHHFTDPTGRALSEPFLRLPSRRFLFFSFFVKLYRIFQIWLHLFL